MIDRIILREKHEPNAWFIFFFKNIWGFNNDQVDQVVHFHEIQVMPKAFTNLPFLLPATSSTSRIRFHLALILRLHAWRTNSHWFFSIQDFCCNDIPNTFGGTNSNCYSIRWVGEEFFCLLKVPAPICAYLGRACPFTPTFLCKVIH